MRVIVPIIVLLIVGIDQVTKYWAATYLQNSADIQVWPGVFHLTYLENRGAAFGMFQGRQILFIVVTIGVLVGLAWYWKHLPKDIIGTWIKIALALVIGGAIGNLIDRVFLNFVRDMMYVILIDFPVFNVADMGVVIGVTMLFPLILLMKDEDENKIDIQEVN
ncbi:MAG: signal peptidase II [Cellulosilyticaceae bacterium]